MAPDPGPEQRAAWMAAAQRGDGAAYERLLASLLGPLRGFVARRGVAASEVEDVVQEILLSLHRARHTWRPERPFEPWLWAIARNATIDGLRRQARDRARHVRASGAERHPAEAKPGDGRDPEQWLLHAEMTPALAAALRDLPPAQRQALELLYVEQLPIADAATRAGVSAGALKVRAHRGARALRATLGPGGPARRSDG